MKSHRGEILKCIIKETNNKVSSVARKMNIDRGTVYRHFDDPNLSIDYLVKYGKAMNYDFSKYFPELLNIVQESAIEYNYQAKTYSELDKELQVWKDKYIQLLEQYNELLLEKK